MDNKSGNQIVSQPLVLSIAEQQLTDLNQRVAQTRFPDEVNDSDWSYGSDLTYMRSLMTHWQTQYDWRRLEQRVNQYENQTITVEGTDIHLLHAPSQHPSAQPLVLLHGWPGCFIEFLDVIEPLRNPEAHGGNAEDAFHIIVPSLIGYGLSGKAVGPGMNTAKMASLMKRAIAHLGYEHYLAQGGDYGSMLARELVRQDSDHCRGMHLNMLILSNFTDADSLEGVDTKVQAAMKAFLLKEMGYYYIQASKPQTLGYGLNDSPAGLAAWLIEKYRRWSDCGGDLDSSYSKDQLLDIISLYWHTESITSSCRHYYEETWSDSDFSGSELPLGFTHFPGETMPPPKKENALALYPNIVQWDAVEKGGHFAALEAPEQFIESVRKFNQAVVNFYQ